LGRGRNKEVNKPPTLVHHVFGNSNYEVQHGLVESSVDYRKNEKKIDTEVKGRSTTNLLREEKLTPLLTPARSRSRTWVGIVTSKQS
jgi:hypothetical protein